jgi:hypothetical protein
MAFSGMPNPRNQYVTLGYRLGYRRVGCVTQPTETTCDHLNRHSALMKNR